VRSERVQPVLFALGLVLLTIAVYSAVWSFDFVLLDDPTYVTKNTNIHEGVTTDAITWALTTGHAANWHPLTWCSHMLDVTLFGLRPGPAHLVNLLWHVAAVVLLFAALARLTSAMGPSAFVAALFAVHPAHVESVAWIAERKDVLSTAFWMLTMLAYASYVVKPGGRRYALVLVAFALGLMAKPMLVTLPCVLLLLDVWPLRRWPATPAWRLVREKLPLFALAAASSVATFVAQRSGGAVMSLDALPFTLRFENAGVSYVSYLATLVWPANLTVYYPHPTVVSFGQLGLCLLILAAISVGVVAFSRSHPYLAVGWLWYLGTLVPVIGLVQVGRQAMADRYTYVPYVGLFIAITWGAVHWIGRRQPPKWALPALACLVLAPYSVAADRQVQHWRNDVSLWSHALQVRLGLDEPRARLAAADLIEDRTMTALLALLENQPGNVGPRLAPADAHQFLGRMFMRHRQVEEAIESFREAIALEPDNAALYSDLGLALAEHGQTELAIAAYRDALKRNPASAQTHNDLGFTLARLGRLEEARLHFTEAVRIDPNLADAHRNLGLALANLGRFDEAINAFKEVLRITPSDANVRRALEALQKRAGKSPGEA